MFTRTPSLFRGHAFLATTLYSALAIGVTFAVTPTFGALFMFFYMATTLAAAHFGTAYGLYSTALCTVGWYFTHGHNRGLQAWARYVSYLFITLTVQYFTEKMRRALKEAQDIAAQQDRFVGMVSHDLRTPLTTISMSVSLLKQGSPETQAKAVVRIQNGAQRMTRLVSDLLDYGRLKHARALPIARADLRVGEIVEKVLKDCCFLTCASAVPCPHGNCRISFQHDGSDDAARADPDRVEQIIVNLLSNAVRHSPPQTPISVLVETMGAYVLVAVENEGEIPAQARRTLFEPFRTGKDGSGSVGLGLYIVKQIAEAHGGHIDVESGNGKTRFTVRLPTTEVVP